MRRTGPGKYDPLRAYLTAFPPETNSITLPLIEMERILGVPLSPPTWTHSFWNNCRSVPRTRSWLDAGWRVASFDRMRGVVTFSRCAPQAGGD